MGMREISNRVVAELEQGNSREDVYQRLSAGSPTDSGKIAYCIASVPTAELRQRYLKYNGGLCLLLALYPILVVLTELPIDLSEPTIFLLLRCVLPLVFSYFVFRYHGGIYRLATIWFLVEVLETLLLTGAPDGVGSLKLMALFFIVLLSFTIGRKVFPNLGIMGPRKDRDGNYLL